MSVHHYDEIEQTDVYLTNFSFFLTLLTKADGNPQVSPDVGTSPDASDTGFEELMDVSDGKRDFTFGLVLGNH